MKSLVLSLLLIFMYHSVSAQFLESMMMNGNKNVLPIITVTPTSPSISDSIGLGQTVAPYVITMSDGSAYTGISPIFIAPNFGGDSTNINNIYDILSTGGTTGNIIVKSPGPGVGTGPKTENINLQVTTGSIKTIQSVSVTPSTFTVPTGTPPKLIGNISATCSPTCPSATFGGALASGNGCTVGQIAQQANFAVSGTSLNTATNITTAGAQNIGIVVTNPGAINNNNCFPVVLTGSSGTVSCVPGSHGLVRGRPQIVNGFVVADDGCILRGVHTGSYCCNDSTTYQNYHNVGHFNAVRHLSFDNTNNTAWSAATLSSTGELAQMDAMVAAASATGMYVVMSLDNAQVQSQVTTAGDKPFWDVIAPRYKNNTNVIFELHNEASNQEPEGVAFYNQTMYSYVRNLAPNTMLWLFDPFGIVADSQATQDGWISGVAPTVNWANAAFSFHSYQSTGSDGVTRALHFKGEGVPPQHDEQCAPAAGAACTGPDPRNLDSLYGAAGIGWFLLDGVGFCSADTNQCYGDPHQSGDVQFSPITASWPQD